MSARVAVVVSMLIAAVGTTGFPSASAAAEEPVVREVLAGGRPAGGASGPFVHTAFYPGTVQAHRGDALEWRFPGSYAWHTVSFGELPERILRDDEYPGHIAFEESWLFGHELGDESKQCGRGKWWHLPDQQTCVLDAAAIAGGLSSSLWDRFFSLAVPDATFAARVELEPGTYPYFCKIHPDMTGALEVVPDGEPVTNPGAEEIESQILADQSAAEELRAELDDPAAAWDPVAEEWVVRVGASTGRVDIHDFLPSSLPVVPGDGVRFEGGTHDPSSVAFPSDAQGGFYTFGSCDPNGCSPGDVDSRGVPWGMTGFAFPWMCDPDDRAGGLPGVPLSYVPPRASQRTEPAGIGHGCPAGTKPEMLVAPYMAEPIRAPGDAVVPGAVHMSGMMMPVDTPAWFGTYPDGNQITHTFHASFPVGGTYTYACLNHEFMKGRIQAG